jgi:uncharacterized repeat protein (TIGR03803 family)
MTLVGFTLYGTTDIGGNGNNGTVFSITTNGTGYTIVHNFAGSPNDGANAPAPLILVGSKLCGTTYSGGSNNLGTVFTMPLPARIIGLTGDLTFGSVPVGTTSQRTLTITNSGNVSLTVSNVDYPPGFSGPWSGSIAAGGSQNVTVTFAPATATNYEGTLTVDSNATSGTGTLSASGTGSCIYTLSSTAASIAAGGIDDSITVFAGNGCAWVAASGASWIHTSSSGTGGGTLSYLVDVNFGVARSGIITVQGQVLTLHQAGNNLSTIGNTTVVVAGDPVLFGPGMFGITTNMAGCQWDFGDGQTNTDCQPSHVFSNCGPHTVTVALNDGISTTTTGMVVAVPCAFRSAPKPVSLKMKSNFAPGKLEQASLKGSVELPPGFGPSNLWATVEIGGVDLDFWLNGKGQGTNGLSRLKLSVKNYKTQTGVITNTIGTVTATLKGDWDATWLNYGLTNATVTALPVTVPVLLLLETDLPESFYMEKSLLYKATAGKSGTAR